MSLAQIKLRDVQGDVLNGGALGKYQGEEIDLLNSTVKLRDRGGQLVTMDLGQADVHIDKTLVNYAAGYRLAMGVADVASPPIVVPNASDKFWTWNQDDAFQLVQDIATAPGADVKEVSPRLSNAPFQTQGFALQAFIPTEVQANADAPLNPVLAAMRRIMNALLLAREFRVQALLRTQANHTFKTVIAAGNKWNGGGGSNPVQDLFTLIENALMPVTDIVMSEQVWHDFAQNAAVQKFVAYKQGVPGIPYMPSDGSSNGQAQQFSALLGLPRINVAAIKYKDTTGAYSYIWGGDVILLHMPPNGAPKDGQDIAPSYTFRWNGGNVGDAVVQGGFIVRSFFNPYRGPRGGTQIVVTHNDAEVMTSTVVSGLAVGAHQ
jgi:hypothetical protein